MMEADIGVMCATIARILSAPTPGQTLDIMGTETAVSIADGEITTRDGDRTDGRTVSLWRRDAGSRPMYLAVIEVPYSARIESAVSDCISDTRYTLSIEIYRDEDGATALSVDGPAYLIVRGAQYSARSPDGVPRPEEASL